MNSKILIIGHGRHGKDSLAEYWRDRFGMTFRSSSMAAAEIFIYQKLKDSLGYSTLEECYEDRHNYRDLWYEMICEYNKTNPSRLAEQILLVADCYVGMRDSREIKCCLIKGLFDIVVWVDASERVPLESASSFQITKDLADVIIENNGSLAEFQTRAERFGKLIWK